MKIAGINMTYEGLIRRIQKSVLYKDKEGMAGARSGVCGLCRDLETPAAHAILVRLADVGLGYLSLGQPLTTLSGGERQRLKPATHMDEKCGVYVLDEPAQRAPDRPAPRRRRAAARPARPAGRLRQVGRRHGAPLEAVMAHADWLIDLGPAPATTAGGSSSREHQPISSPPTPPLRMRTSRGTWAPVRLQWIGRCCRLTRALSHSLSTARRYWGTSRFRLAGLPYKWLI
jgi:hypothetical protein